MFVEGLTSIFVPQVAKCCPKYVVALSIQYLNQILPYKSLQTSIQDAKISSSNCKTICGHYNVYTYVYKISSN